MAVFRSVAGLPTAVGRPAARLIFHPRHEAPAPHQAQFWYVNASVGFTERTGTMQVSKGATCVRIAGAQFQAGRVIGIWLVSVVPLIGTSVLL